MAISTAAKRPSWAVRAAGAAPLACSRQIGIQTNASAPKAMRRQPANGFALIKQAAISVSRTRPIVRTWHQRDGSPSKVVGPAQPAPSTELAPPPKLPLGREAAAAGFKTGG